MKNPYEILGLNSNASLNDIKTSYKKNALKHHPDRGGDEAIFKEMTEAYSILSDPEKFLFKNSPISSYKLINSFSSPNFFP